MTPVDHLLIFLLFVVQPIRGAYESCQYAKQEARGEELDRVEFYRQTAIMEWTYMAVLAVLWVWLGRPLADLGFVAARGAGFWISLFLLLVGTILLYVNWVNTKKASDEERQKAADSYGCLTKYMPQSRHDLAWFYGVSTTAGIVEEIVFRGFVLWYLSSYIGLWTAVFVSSIGFGLAHSYQGFANGVRCGLVGLAFALLYVYSGSIWLPIAGHILLDVLQGAVIYETLRTRTASEHLPSSA